AWRGGHCGCGSGGPRRDRSSTWLSLLALPAGLDDARQVARERHQPEADAAEAELAQVSARTAAALATVAVTHRELRLLQGLGDFGGGGHASAPLPAHERH